MSNINALIKHLSESGLYKKFEDFCYNIDIIDEHLIKFEVIVSTMNKIKQGDYPDTFLLTYCIDIAGKSNQWIDFQYYHSFETDDSICISENISETSNSVNTAMEKILPFIFSDSDDVYDYVYSTHGEHKEKLYNKLIKKDKHDQIIKSFMQMSEQLNTAYKACQSEQSSQLKESLIDTFSRHYPITLNNYFDVKTKMWNESAYHFLIRIHNDKLHTKSPVIEIEISYYIVNGEPQASINIKYSDSGWLEDTTGIMGMKCLSNASLVMTELMQDLSTHKHYEQLIAIAKDH